MDNQPIEITPELETLIKRIVQESVADALREYTHALKSEILTHRGGGRLWTKRITTVNEVNNG